MGEEAKSQRIIKVTKLIVLLVSISVCSFLYTPSSSSMIAFLHDFNLHFSSFPFQLFHHTIDKNSMFLLCNGLLVFVGITRSFSNSSTHHLQNGSQSGISEIEAKQKKESEEHVGFKEEEEENGELGFKEEDDGDEEEGKLSENVGFVIEEAEEEEEDWRVSTEEMNKKFDDFIRRMKQDLRFN